MPISPLLALLGCDSGSKTDTASEEGSCFVRTSADDASNSDSIRYLANTYSGFEPDFHDCDAYGDDASLYDQAIKFVSEELNYDSASTVTDDTIVLNSTLDLGNRFFTLIMGNVTPTDGVIILNGRDNIQHVDPVVSCSDSAAQDITLRNMLILTDNLTRDQFFQETCLAGAEHLAVCPGDYLPNDDGTYACDTDQDG